MFVTAAAALLVHAAAIDGNISDIERDKLHTVIQRRFDLDEAATDQLLTEATPDLVRSLRRLAEPGPSPRA